MKLLFVSGRPSGAFVMREGQIAATRPDWRATAAPAARDFAGIDAVVITKSADDATLRLAHASGAPVIYDALDFWRQVKSRWLPPSRAQRLRSAEAAAAHFAGHFARIAPDVIVCATERMAEDLAPLGIPTRVIAHHFDPRLPTADDYARARPAVGRKRLLYFGKRSFLGEWEGRIARACRAQGAAFTACDIGRGAFTTPPVADAMIAVRGGRDGCWLSRRWKSNVKAATAARLGLPLVAWPEAACLETAPEAHWFQTEADLATALAAALTPGARRPTRLIAATDAAAAFEALARDCLAGRAGAGAAALMR